MVLPTSVFNMFALECPEVFSRLQVLLVGGEMMLPEAARNTLTAVPRICLFNAYGST